MSEPQLGMILEGPCDRDAIHVAIAPVIASQKLNPGQHVGFIVPGNTSLVGICENTIGVIDPYLKKPVLKNQQTWLLLYPRTVTSLKHEWTHPAFEDAVDTSASEIWLREFAENLEMTYTAFLTVAKRHIDNGHTHCLPFDTPEFVYTESEEMWRHFNIVTGMNVDNTGSFFTCAC